MKKAYLTLTVVIVINALLLASCGSSSTPATEEDLCQAAFDAIQASDQAAFSGLFLDAESVTAMVAAMGEATGPAAEIKGELLEFDIAEIHSDRDAFYQKLQAAAEADGLDLKAATYEGIVEGEDRFAVTNLTARTVHFKLAFATMNYIVRVDLLQSPAGNYIYETKLKTYPKVDISFVSPAGDRVELVLGEALDYEVAFDVEAANEQGAWIQILFDGKNAGMVAGTTLEAPYTSDVPAQALKAGEHTLTCRLQPVGRQTGYPLGEAVLTIVVK